VLVERENELKTLTKILAKADKGQGQIVLVSGEAGIGKSSLIQAMQRNAREATPKLNWFEGGCEALFTPRTLGPVYDMAPQMGRMVEMALQAESGPSALYYAILSALEKAQPAVMVCEDLHWADHATLDLIKYIARRLNLLRVTLILSFRDDEIQLTHPLTQLLGDLPGTMTTRLPLNPLTEAGVIQLSENSKVDGKAVFSITDGNPFYVSELIAAGTDSAYVPASVKDAVALRLAQLSSNTRELLERLSVMPKSSRIEFLQALIGDNLSEQLADGLARGFLVEDGVAVRFRHDLTRLAIFDRLSPSRRRQYHADCLRILENETNAPMLDRLVHHAAGAQDSGKVLRFAPLAAEAAAIAGAHGGAAAHYALALKFVNEAEPELAARLYESWAYESTLSDQMGEDVLDGLRHAITLWRALNRPDKVGRCLRQLSRIHWYRGESVSAARYADQAIQVLEALPASAERGMAYSMRSQLHMLNDQMEQAIEWGFRALDFESDHPDLEIRMHALNNIGTAMIFRDNRDGLIHLKESLRLALAHGHHENAARAYNNLAEYAVEFRDFKLAEEMLEAALKFDKQNDLDAWTHYLSGRLGQMRMDQGKLDEGIAIASEIISDPHCPTLLSRLPANLVISRARMRKGDPEAEALLQETLSNALATDEKQHIVPARLSIIEWAWLSDKTATAMEHIQRLMQLTQSDRHPWNMGDRAIWADRFGFQPSLNIMKDLPEPYRLELEGKYEAAAKSWDHIGAPYESAMVKLRSQNKTLVTEAIEAFQEIGAGLALQKARTIAEGLGLKIKLSQRKRGPYQATREHPLGLTAKEQEVLSCLKEGLSNREIADQLSRSQRTVEHHVSAILGKLDATNRTSAILRVQREPWLVDTSLRPD
tara:strand:- start:30533 stop:33181 length:2649 start_codon:yes stop_codon:yes gene_type:complete